MVLLPHTKHQTKIQDEENENRKRTNNLIRSSEILEQKLVGAKQAGLEVEQATQRVRQVTNTLAQQGVSFTKQQLILLITY